MPNPFGVMVNGQPIDTYNFRASPVSISYTLRYELEMARIHAGLSITEFEALPGTLQWLDPEQHTHTKSDLIMLYRMTNRIRAIPEDVQAREIEKRNRRGKSYGR